jgi:hypothetical protein
MKLHNTTDIPDETVREVLNFVRPSGVHHVDVYVENRSYGVGSGRASRHGYVTVRIDRELPHPIRWTPQHEHGYIFDDYVRSREEVLVMLLAHELRHQWQFGKGQSIGEMLRRTKGMRYRPVMVTAVRTLLGGSMSRDAPKVTLGHTTYYNAELVKVRKVRRTAVKRRRGQKGGCERDADRYAMKMLRAWRRDHPQVDWSAAAIGEVV